MKKTDKHIPVLNCPRREIPVESLVNLAREVLPSVIDFLHDIWKAKRDRQGNSAKTIPPDITIEADYVENEGEVSGKERGAGNPQG